MDGEGCITISHRQTSDHYLLRVDVGMTDKALPILHALKDQYGGNVNPTRPERDRWRAAWCWRVFSQQAEQFLRAVQPWVRIKQTQVRVALTYMDLHESRQGANGRVVWDSDLRQAGAWARREIQAANRKGPDEKVTPGWVAALVEGRWVTPQQSLLPGGDEMRGSFPKHGEMRNGRVYPLRAQPTPTEAVAEAVALLPTPRVSAERSSRHAMVENRQWSAPSLAQALELVQGILPREFRTVEEVRGGSRALLPTPVTTDANAACNRTAERADPDSGHHDGMTLTDAVRLLPTPRARDHKGGGSLNPHPDLATAVETLLPTPTSRDHKGRNQRADEYCLPGAVETLLPTPQASDGTGGGIDSEVGGNQASGSKKGIPLGTAVHHLLPTPKASDGPKESPNHTGDGLGPAIRTLLPTPTSRLAEERGAQAKRYTNPSRSYDLDDAISWIGDGSNPPSDSGRPSPATPSPHQPELAPEA